VSAAVKAPTLEELEARYVELSEQRDAAVCKLIEFDEQAEHQARVDELRGDLQHRPGAIINAGVQLIRKRRTNAVQDVEGLDADLRAIETLIGEARAEQDAVERAAAVEERDRLRKLGEKAWAAALDSFIGFHQQWQALASTLSAIVQQQEAHPEIGDWSEALPVQELPGDVQSLLQQFLRAALAWPNGHLPDDRHVDAYLRRLVSERGISLSDAVLRGPGELDIRYVKLRNQEIGIEGNPWQTGFGGVQDEAVELTAGDEAQQAAAGVLADILADG
jgi:hypothetical protein